MCVCVFVVRVMSFAGDETLITGAFVRLAGIFAAKVYRGMDGDNMGWMGLCLCMGPGSARRPGRRDGGMRKLKSFDEGDEKESNVC